MDDKAVSSAQFPSVNGIISINTNHIHFLYIQGDSATQDGNIFPYTFATKSICFL